MRFCTKCGHKLEDEYKVCPKCGSSVTDKKSQASALNKIKAEESKVETISPVRKSISKKMIIAIASVAVVVIFVGVFIYFGKTQSNPSKVVKNFEEAVAKKDKAKIEKLVEYSNNNAKMDDASANILIKYFNSNKSYSDSVLSELNDEADTINADSPSLTSNSYAFRMEREGNKYLFFPNYKIIVKPAYVTVKTKFKGTNIYLNNEKIGTVTKDNDNKQYGPFLPGKYTIKAVYKGKYASPTDSKNVNTLKTKNNKISIVLLKDLKYVKIDSDEKDAEIFIGDKDTGKKIKDIKTIGPVDKKTSIYGTIKKDGKIIKSDIQKLEYSYDINGPQVYLDFFNSKYKPDSNEWKIKQLLQDYTLYFGEAVNDNNMSLIQKYLYPDSDLYKQQEAYIKDAYSKKIVEMNQQCNIVSCDFSSDSKSGTVVTHEVYDIDSDNGETYVTSKKEFNYKYTFKYNDAVGAYQLASVENVK
ncbi:putative membrane protein YvbJ [Clostridium acetobutylicum]|uniref:Membrane-associated protein TcaA n=1 Tax=Clostridium acetobutylicum (strain ATCC 824 / DSM 792 / JCM 1419 / IAM 19013 / LMG 5710 / NBRC 13948 / NRRL B-527 / VKM B-1787 / 2291 / W) TaxID=272562 RepID=Q97E81_CLOAB|nr:MULTISPECIES: zinc ribbon domain-containing protein [Clostridium]AAK81169.1 Uncharacterized conserved protein, YVBJ B.subtilis ortholog with N-terminal C4-type Zn-finger domain [Clostridium acetobutylicum ATCC 824]ADZ22274.1 Conserved hypothetical protein [Clostridium acetobutylicum EA 2018]AEI34692.1 hypothetical protein SMB_G3270 [Clostridium acetobutylicum DSM 1731]AWV81163.1 zinc ribbon domain-containing protein [Clostridium acetobutylicum]MBC2395635.1 zinc ribbon domain-containing prot